MSQELGTIHQLSSEVIDQIAAGEVVERPAHMVKELIENSLDAGATDILIQVREGGRDVLVKDNGSGMVEIDLARAIDRHTTSKISSSSDLWKLGSYGFRGEALASIASVSHLILTSKTEKSEVGFRIESHFGKKSEIDPIGHTRGTQIHVRDLFENVPARLKFLKTASAEVGAIRQVVKAMALARFDVGFQFFVEGKLDLHYAKATDRGHRAEQVLEVSPLYQGVAQREGVSAQAVYASPNETAKTTKNIWIFAQNRWIQDRSLQAAVMDSFRTLLMHGEFPYAVVWVEAPEDQIDVNIHPTKSQVKFQNPSLAFRAVAGAIRESIEKAPWLAQILRAESSPPPIDFSQGNSSQEIGRGQPLAPVQNAQFLAPEFESTQYAKKSFSSVHVASPGSSQPKVGMADLVRAAQSRLELSDSREPSRTQGSWTSVQYLGQANLTYLICQRRDGLLIVDQHAAHERVLFERIMKVWKEGGVQAQEFLFPLSIDLGAEKKEALMWHEADLAKLGVVLEEMGPQTVGIRAAPLWIKEAILPRVLDQVAHQVVENGGSFAFETYVADLAATMACHSAVRAGQALSEEEALALLAQMDEFPLSSFCPHGRPVSVDYRFSDLEKDFGRTLS